MNYDSDRDPLEELEEDVTEYIGKNEHSKELALPQQSLPKRMYVLPVSNRPFFPAQVQPVVVNQNPWQETLKRVSETDHKMLGICFVDDHQPGQSVPASNELATVGCAVRIHHAQNKDGNVQFIAQGLQRFRIVQWLRRKPPYLVEVEYPQEPEEDADETKAYTLAIISAIKELLRLCMARK